MVPTKISRPRVPSVAAGHAEVALHGYSHQLAEGTPLTEFAGLSYRDQERRITAGKAELERQLGVRVSTFIPPWNSYDIRTVRALPLCQWPAWPHYKSGPANVASSFVCAR